MLHPGVYAKDDQVDYPQRDPVHDPNLDNLCEEVRDPHGEVERKVKVVGDLDGALGVVDKPLAEAQKLRLAHFVWHKELVRHRAAHPGGDGRAQHQVLYLLVLRLGVLEEGFKLPLVPGPEGLLRDGALEGDEDGSDEEDHDEEDEEVELVELVYQQVVVASVGERHAGKHRVVPLEICGEDKGDSTNETECRELPKKLLHDLDHGRGGSLNGDLLEGLKEHGASHNRSHKDERPLPLNPVLRGGRRVVRVVRHQPVVLCAVLALMLPPLSVVLPLLSVVLPFLVLLVHRHLGEDAHLLLPAPRVEQQRLLLPLGQVQHVPRAVWCDAEALGFLVRHVRVAAPLPGPQGREV
mmetsp:Transcript_6483/g.14934  ORF Transcript_6483/g.14934 Transcript_6483/m.14934 type:complete len:352 (-) Transcript_6483:212-1267(-)